MIFGREKAPINACGKDNLILWNTSTGEISFKTSIEAPTHHLIDIRGEYPLDRVIKNIGLNEEELAEFLIRIEAPAMVEQIIVAAFNQQKKEKLAFQDKINKKKQEIIRSYK